MKPRDKWGRRKNIASGNADIPKVDCPFCGSRKLRTHSRANKSGTSYWVQCECGAKGVTAATRRSAGAEWNKRASVKPPVAHAMHRVLNDAEPCCCCDSKPEVLSYNVGSQIRCSNPKCFTAIGFDKHRYNAEELTEMWNSLHEIGEGSVKLRKLRDEDNQAV